MKAKVTRPDGSVIEFEGTAEEIRVVLNPEPAVFITAPEPLPIDWKKYLDEVSQRQRVDPWAPATKPWWTGPDVFRIPGPDEGPEYRYSPYQPTTTSDSTKVVLTDDSGKQG